MALALRAHLGHLDIRPQFGGNYRRQLGALHRMIQLIEVRNLSRPSFFVISGFYSGHQPECLVVDPALTQAKRIRRRPIMKSRLRQTIDLGRAEAPPFMSKTDHSTSETDRSWRNRTIHDDSKAPAGSRLDSKARQLQLMDLGQAGICITAACLPCARMVQPQAVPVFWVSGRGSLPHMDFQELGSQFPLASSAASPARLSPFFGGSSERLCNKCLPMP